MFVDVWHLMNVAVTSPSAVRTRVGPDRGVLRPHRAQGSPRAHLEVRASNAAAIELYRSFGFVATGARPGYYSDDREDAVIMWKDWEGETA